MASLRSTKAIASSRAALAAAPQVREATTSRRRREGTKGSFFSCWKGKLEKKPSFAFNHFNIQPFAFKTPRFQTPKNAFTQTSYTKDLRGLGSPPSSGRSCLLPSHAHLPCDAPTDWLRSTERLPVGRLVVAVCARPVALGGARDGSEKRGGALQNKIQPMRADRVSTACFSSYKGVLSCLSPKPRSPLLMRLLRVCVFANHLITLRVSLARYCLT